jgi:glycerol-3-phosphate dehydrogenase
MKHLHTDIVIVGAGIAGLWLLNSLTKQGYDVILLEANNIGGGQSIHSQGIIHGGIKYALNGVLSQASDAIKDMPARWKKSLEGNGELDLRGVTQLSDAHYLYSQRSLGAKITSFFAKKVMSGRVDSVSRSDYPRIFQHADFKGNLYKLDEIVLDVPSLLTKLSQDFTQRILRFNTANCQWQKDSQGNIVSLINDKQQLSIKAQRFVFTAGEGNADILKALKIEKPQMQLRPLHMTMAIHQTNLPIYAHCIGSSTKPLATITHHINQDGSYAWYFGGDIAETGVERNAQQQILATQQLMQRTLPWVDLKDLSWRTLRINRAEPKQSSLGRPDAAFLHADANHLTAWPTKLALTPDLSDKVIHIFQQQQLKPVYRLDNQQLFALQLAGLSRAPWSLTQ